MYPILSAEFIARKHRAIQLGILRLHPDGELIPIIADSDWEKGVISLIAQGVSRTIKYLK